MTTRLTDGLVRNGPVRMDQLPLGIVVWVFQHAAGLLEVPIPDDWFSRLHVLARVCKTWAILIRSSPRLWFVVDRRQPKHIRETTLRLSHWIIVFLYPIWGAEDGLATIVAQARRWRAATFWDPSWRDLRLLGGGEGFFSALEELFIYSPRERKTIDIFPSGGLSNLFHLQLQNVVLRNWTRPILDGRKLKSLKLLDCTVLDSNVTQLLECLETCWSGLEELCVQSVSFEESGERGVQAGSITFPNLSIIRFYNCSPQSTFIALCNYFQPRPDFNRIPACRYLQAGPSLSLSANEYQPALALAKDLVTSILHQTTPVMRASWTDLTINDSSPFTIWFTFACPSTSSTFNRTLTLPTHKSHPRPDILLRSLTTLLNPFTSALPKLLNHVVLTHRLSYVGGLIQAITQLPSRTVSLTLLNWQDSDLYQTLSHLATSSKTLPWLRRLVIKGCVTNPFTPRTILKLVKRRSRREGHDFPVDGGPHLEELTIRECDDMAMNVETFTKLQVILGDGVTWDCFNGR